MFNIAFMSCTASNIETVFQSSGKGLFQFDFHWHHVGATTVSYLTGNISILGDKYDMVHLQCCRVTVTGTLSSLNKLQKLTWVKVSLGNQITGAKTDLYNNGANITYWDCL